MISARRAVPAAFLAFLLAGCAAVTDGRGSAGPSGSGAGSSSRPDFPSTTPASSSSSAASPSSTPRPSATSIPGSARAASLARASGGDEISALVAVPGGYEAASSDQRGQIRFWFDPQASTEWHRIGASRYPYTPRLGPPGARVTGALLRNMRHATFIVFGLFTPDRSGNAVAFTTGRRGWGAIKAERDGDIGPSGRPVGRDRIGLSYGFAFSHGYLVTADCSSDRPISECDDHPVVKRWVWTGSDFRRV